jgi:uncharacterized protein
MSPTEVTHTRSPGQSVLMMHLCALTVDLHIPAATSLKAKRTVIKHLVETSKVRFGVAAAETGHQDQWQRSELGFAAVAGSSKHVEEVLDSVERFVWSHPEVNVLDCVRTWLDTGQ